jgi:hypothetical protein
MLTDTYLVSVLITFLPLPSVAAVLASCKSSSKALSSSCKKALIEQKRKIAVALTDEQVEQIAIGCLNGGGYTDSEADFPSITDYRDDEAERSEYSGPDQAGDFSSDECSISPVECPWN